MVNIIFLIIHMYLAIKLVEKREGFSYLKILV